MAFAILARCGKFIASLGFRLSKLYREQCRHTGKIHEMHLNEIRRVHRVYRVYRVCRVYRVYKIYRVFRVYRVHRSTGLQLY